MGVNLGARRIESSQHTGKNKQSASRKPHPELPNQGGGETCPPQKPEAVVTGLSIEIGQRTHQTRHHSARMPPWSAPQWKGGVPRGRSHLAHLPSRVIQSIIHAVGEIADMEKERTSGSVKRREEIQHGTEKGKHNTAQRFPLGQNNDFKI